MTKEKCVYIHLRRAGRTLASYYDRMLAPSGITAAQYSLLCHLDQLGTCLLYTSFETMMQDLRLTGKYCDVAYNYSGPAHLGIGQESVAAVSYTHLDVYKRQGDQVSSPIQSRPRQ